MQDSRRRLPHRYPQDKWLFLTWHLHGSLPHALYPPAHQLSDGKAFAWMDRYLDTTREGPMYLRRQGVAQIVVECWKRGVEWGHYELRAYVIMANHVHVLLLPKVAPAGLLQSLKGVTAREANRLWGRTGESFWQRESYDHGVRDSRELERIVAHIENNRVKAGLVARAEDYRWSSAADGKAAGAETSLGAARKSACATSLHPQDNMPCSE